MHRYVILGVLVPAIAATQQPAMFRANPSHTGVYSGGGPSIVGLQWRFPTDGDVIASPIVVGSAVFVGSGTGKLFAIDKRTGEERWSYDARTPIQSSAAVADGLVFFEGRDGSVHAVDAATGKRRWRMGTGPDLPLPWGHESGDLFIASPTIADGTLFIGSGNGVLYALDPSSGSVRWKAKTNGRIRAAPAIADGRVVVGSFDGRVYAFDETTGRTLWTYDTKGTSLKSQDYGFDRRSIQSSPAIANGVVYVGARDGFLYALDAATGKLRWTFDHQVSWINSSPAVANGVVYDGSSDGHFVQAVDAATGAERWRAKSKGGVVWSSPALTDRYAYWGEGFGFVHVTDRTNGAEVSTFRIGGQIHSSPVIDRDLLFVGSGDGAVYALRLGDAASVTKRAVFMDSAFVKNSTTSAADITAFLVNRGYESLNTAKLTRFVEQRTEDRAPSVIVFAVDAVPDELLRPTPRASLFRRYLDAGGKVIWLGLPPTIWPVDPAKGQRGGLNEIAWDAPHDLIGVSFGEAIFDQRGARANTLGLRWGLPPHWRTGWSVNPAKDLVVLGDDDLGQAAAWVKSFGGGPGTGFVQVPPDVLQSVFLAAEYRPSLARSIQTRKANDRIH